MLDKDVTNEELEILQRRIKERRLFLDLTYQELADKTGMSKSTLQRYETGGIKNLSYDKIYRLAEALEVSPSFFTNIDPSVDYTGENNRVANKSRDEQRSEYIWAIKNFEDTAIKHITPALVSQGYSVERESHGSVGDIVATKGKEVWHIDFMYRRDIEQYPTGMGMQRHQLMLRYGRIAMYDKPITKYSIVINIRVLAEQLLQRGPGHLGIDFSVIILKEDGYEELFFEK